MCITAEWLTYSWVSQLQSDFWLEGLIPAVSSRAFLHNTVERIESTMTLNTDLHYNVGTAIASRCTEFWTEVLPQKFIMLQSLKHRGN